MSLTYEYGLRQISTPAGEYIGPCPDPIEAQRRLVARQNLQRIDHTAVIEATRQLYPDAVPLAGLPLPVLEEALADF